MGVSNFLAQRMVGVSEATTHHALRKKRGTEGLELGQKGGHLSPPSVNIAYTEHVAQVQGP